MGSKRLAKECKNLAEEDLGWASAEPQEDDIYKWAASIAGPEGSPYEEGVFNLVMVFPEAYPFKPPDVRFTTMIYHPNVKKDTGEICADIIKEDWKPSHDIKWILNVLRNLMVEPSTDSPLEPEIAQLYQTDRAAYDAKAREFTAKFAT